MRWQLNSRSAQSTLQLPADQSERELHFHAAWNTHVAISTVIVPQFKLRKIISTVSYISLASQQISILTIVSAPKASDQLVQLTKTWAEVMNVRISAVSTSLPDCYLAA